MGLWSRQIHLEGVADHRPVGREEQDVGEDRRRSENSIPLDSEWRILRLFLTRLISAFYPKQGDDNHLRSTHFRQKQVTVNQSIETLALIPLESPSPALLCAKDRCADSYSESID